VPPVPVTVGVGLGLLGVGVALALLAVGVTPGIPDVPPEPKEDFFAIQNNLSRAKRKSTYNKYK
jgi:hypothetical protein